MNRSCTMLALAALCSAPVVASAQDFGLKGGYSWSHTTQTGVVPGGFNGRTGFTAGISLATGPNVIGLGIEGLYAQRGVVGSTDSTSQRSNYIDVPAYLRLMIPTGSVAPFILAGPQVSFELQCSGGCPSGHPTTSYAGIIGAGLRFGGRGALTVEGRYIYGLTDLKYGTVSNSGSYRGRSFVILGGLHF